MNTETTNTGNSILNRQAIDKNWSELKGKIKSKWNKFSDDEVEGVKADLNQICGKVQQHYGVGKDNAENQYQDFKKSVETLIYQSPDMAKVAQAAPASEAAPAKVSKIG